MGGRCIYTYILHLTSYTILLLTSHTTRISYTLQLHLTPGDQGRRGRPGAVEAPGRQLSDEEFWVLQDDIS